jgi:fructokinase
MENPNPNPDAPILVAAAGEALIDLIGRPDGTFEACIGGAVFNLGRALSIQGVGTAYLNPLSRDRFGRQMAASLRADGVALGQPEPVHEGTSLAVVALGEGGHPDYAFYREQVADRATTAAALNRTCDAMAGLQVVCTGALALAAEDAGVYLPWLRAQKAAGKLVVVDANLRPSAMKDLGAYRANVMAALQEADIIKVSDEDLDHLAVPGTDALQRAKDLLAATPARLLALTLGPDGACLLVRGADGAVRTWRAREPKPIAVVDTVGAGDSFLAGLLAALLRGGGSPRARLAALDDARARHLLGHALASASLCVMQRGCVPPSWDAAERRVPTLDCAPLAG